MLAILGDTHTGAHSSNPAHHEYMSLFFKDFFKYVDAHNIKNVIQLGDLFDVRKHVTTWSLNWFKSNFIREVISRNMNVWVLVGNHDIHYRESVKLSSVKEVLDPYSDWFTIVEEPADYCIDNKWFLLVPWVCRENQQQVTEAISNSVSEYCCGHFEFDGFELYKGQLAKSTHSHTHYNKFHTVFSGHYHHMSRKDNIIYTGTPYELTWQDSGTAKGFFVLDDREHFIENPHKIYSKFAISSVDQKNLSPLVTSKHVRVILDELLEPKQRERLEDLIYSLSPLSVKFIEQVVDKTTVPTVNYSSTVPISSIITDYVSTVTLPDTVERDILNTVMLQLHQEASTSASND